MRKKLVMVILEEDELYVVKAGLRRLGYMPEALALLEKLNEGAVGSRKVDIFYSGDVHQMVADTLGISHEDAKNVNFKKRYVR